MPTMQSLSGQTHSFGILPGKCIHDLLFILQQWCVNFSSSMPVLMVDNAGIRFCHSHALGGNHCHHYPREVKTVFSVMFWLVTLGVTNGEILCASDLPILVFVETYLLSFLAVVCCSHLLQLSCHPLFCRPKLLILLHCALQSRC
jgi:hypothetical protein